VWWHKRSRDARNILFEASLEFGANWRRNIAELAAERLPRLSDVRRAALAREIEATRTAIEYWVLDRWETVGGAWSSADAEAAREFIATTYPWMDSDNSSRALNQATYYAWHG
jgi:hypothetical protein